MDKFFPVSNGLGTHNPDFHVLYGDNPDFQVLYGDTSYGRPCCAPSKGMVEVDICF